MRSHGTLLALAVLAASCAGVPETALAPAPDPAPEAAAPTGLLLPEDPLAAARDALRARPDGIRLLVVVSPT